MTVVVRPERETDREAIRSVHRAAFDSEAEADLVDSLRAGGFVEVSLVAVVGGDVVGHILFSRLPIITGGGTVAALSLAPIGVAPGFQRQGIGRRLIEEGLKACRERGHRIVVVLGHAEFYPRFGFSTELARPLRSPFGPSESWMATELVPGALAGVEGTVQYPPPFGLSD